LTQNSSISNTSYCRGNDKCVYGFFTKELIPNPGDLGGQDLGATVVTLTG